VSLVVGRFWPLIASFGVHAALATAFMTHGAVAKSPPTPRPVARDVWIGDTLEVAEPAARNSPEESTPSPAHPDVQPATSEPVPRAKPVALARSVVRPLPDPEDSLAQRILAYRPKSGGGAATDSASGDVVRAKTGGMAGNESETSARGFAKAFARAVPAANNGDPIWGELPLGPVGFVRVSVTVGADGTIDDSKVWDKPRKPPPHLERFVDRTLILLRGGRFALTGGGAGTETLRLDVTLSERRIDNGPLALGFEAPSPGNPGRAYFQLASGRFVEARVAIERP
jgi:hypothetical protein